MIRNQPLLQDIQYMFCCDHLWATCPPPFHSDITICFKNINLQWLLFYMKDFAIQKKMYLLFLTAEKIFLMWLIILRIPVLRDLQRKYCMRWESVVCVSHNCTFWMYYLILYLFQPCLLVPQLIFWQQPVWKMRKKRKKRRPSMKSTTRHSMVTAKRKGTR